MVLDKIGKTVGHNYRCPCGNKAVARISNCWCCQRCANIEAKNEWVAKQRDKTRLMQQVFFNQDSAIT